LPVLLVVLLAVITAAPVDAADAISDGQWYHQFLNTAQAHEISQGDGVTVAVLDTGVEATHPDLVGSILPGMDFTGAGDGHVDEDGHGTAMASLIVAHGRVRGVAPAARVLPVRVSVIDQTGSGRFSDGIPWAVAHGAKVISISFGGHSDDILQRQEIQKALAADVVVVAAAGNRPDDKSIIFPAYVPGVVAVAAVDKDGNQADFSVRGQEVVIAAPGVGNSTAVPGGKYIVGSGTSDATAIVAGAVALIRSRFPQLKAPEVIRRLTATAIDKGSPGRDPDYGYGVLNIVGALTADLPAATSPSVKASSAASAQPPSKQDRFPWWLLAIIAVPIVAVVFVVALIWARRRVAAGQ
jgi:type VII secretion-associated serine protease mycosin